MIDLNRQHVTNLNQFGGNTWHKLLLLHDHGSLILGDDIVVLVVMLSKFFFVYNVLQVKEVLELGGTVGGQTVINELSHIFMIGVCKFRNLLWNHLALDFSFQSHNYIAHSLNACHVVH